MVLPLLILSLQVCSHILHWMQTDINQFSHLILFEFILYIYYLYFFVGLFCFMLIFISIRHIWVEFHVATWRYYCLFMEFYDSIVYHVIAINIINYYRVCVCVCICNLWLNIMFVRQLFDSNCLLYTRMVNVAFALIVAARIQNNCY